MTAELQALVNLGFHMLRIKPGNKGDKAPFGRWRDKASVPPEDFKPEHGVGFRNGALSNNIIDLDLDNEWTRLVAAWPEFFGNDISFGRDGLPDPGHYLFKIDDLPDDMAKKKQTMKVAGMDFCDLRTASEGYTILPREGFVMAEKQGHPEYGTSLVWTHGFPEEIKVYPWAYIKARVRQMVFCALALRAYPKEGGRDDYTLTLAGAMAVEGFPLNNACEYMERMATITGDDDVPKRVENVRRAFGRKESGQAVQGIGHLKTEETWGEGAVGDWLKYLRPRREVAGTKPGAIDINNPSLTKFMAEVTAAMHEKMPGEVFKQLGALVRIKNVEKKQTIQKHGKKRGVEIHPGGVGIVKVKTEWLSPTLDLSGVDFVVVSPKGQEMKVWPPRTAIKHFIEFGENLPFEIITGVSMVPTLSSEVEGYDPDTGVLNHFNGTIFPPALDQPTKDDAIAARDRLLAPVAGFPFVTPAARSVFLSGLISGVIRRELSTCPMHLIDAPEAGTGKTFLSHCIGITINGAHPASLTYTSDLAEMSKMLAGVLMEGVPVIAYDNVERGDPIEGNFIASCLTDHIKSFRVLGHNQMLTMPTTVLMLATGNNIRVRGDMLRRVIKCRIDSGLEKPDLREFDFDPRDRYRENRPQNVRDILTVLQGYIKAGRPCDPPNLGSFEDYTLVRGAIIWIDMKDPVDTQDEFRGDDPERAARVRLFEALFEQFGIDSFTSAEVAALGKDGFELHPILQGLSDLSGSDDLWQGDAKTVGMRLAGLADIRAGRFLFKVGHDKGKNRRCFKIETPGG